MLGKSISKMNLINTFKLSSGGFEIKIEYSPIYIVMETHLLMEHSREEIYITRKAYAYLILSFSFYPFILGFS